jgi:hypothetical protein
MPLKAPLRASASGTAIRPAQVTTNASSNACSWIAVPTADCGKTAQTWSSGGASRTGGGPEGGAGVQRMMGAVLGNCARFWDPPMTAESVAAAITSAARSSPFALLLASWPDALEIWRRMDGDEPWFSLYVSTGHYLPGASLARAREGRDRDHAPAQLRGRACHRAAPWHRS